MWGADGPGVWALPQHWEKPQLPSRRSFRHCSAPWYGLWAADPGFPAQDRCLPCAVAPHITIILLAMLCLTAFPMGVVGLGRILLRFLQIWRKQQNNWSHPLHAMHTTIAGMQEPPWLSHIWRCRRSLGPDPIPWAVSRRAALPHSGFWAPSKPSIWGLDQHCSSLLNGFCICCLEEGAEVMEKRQKLVN